VLKNPGEEAHQVSPRNYLSIFFDASKWRKADRALYEENATLAYARENTFFQSMPIKVRFNSLYVILVGALYIFRGAGKPRKTGRSQALVGDNRAFPFWYMVQTTLPAC